MKFEKKFIFNFLETTASTKENSFLNLKNKKENKEKKYLLYNKKIQQKLNINETCNFKLKIFFTVFYI